MGSRRAKLAFGTRTVVKRAFARIGFDIRRANASQTAEIGHMRNTLEGLRDRGLSPSSILDVGANRGDWTELASEVFPLSSYIMIEPQVEMAPYLDKLGYPWHNVAAGRVNGVLDLTIWPDLVGSAFVEPTSNDDQTAHFPRRSVKVVTIDDLISEHNYPIPELVKLDIQGFELEALRGAECLFNVTEAFILEVALFPFSGHPILREVVDFMGERGYETYDIAGALRRPSDGALGQVDLCFARANGVLRASHAW